MRAWRSVASVASRVRRPAISRPARCSRSAVSSASSSPWRRAASAWRSSGRSWRRTSRSRSWTRRRLPSVASRRRSAFSLRLRYLRTPAASSTIWRRSSGPGVEDGVDLTLADDHVLLAADAGVGEQLLHVEQAARHAVDGVLALPGAEQDPRDGDLGELDGQQAGGVVDGEADLGPPEGRPLGRAGEDHVVHALAAHGARGLGAQHPGDGVDHVGLAAAVRADHDADPRLEA